MMAGNGTKMFRPISCEQALATDIGGSGLSDGGGCHKHLNLRSASHKLNVLAGGRIPQHGSRAGPTATDIGGSGLSGAGGCHKHLNLRSASHKLNVLAGGRIL